MMSRESAEQWRKMSFSERWKIVQEMIREDTRHLLQGTPEQVDRRFELLRRENDERNRNMLTAIARTKEPQ